MKQYKDIKILLLIPATIRPNIFRQTIETFYYNMLCSVYPITCENYFIEILSALHLDNVGEIDKYSQFDITYLIDKYTDRYHYKFNETSTHSLANAFYTLWEVACDSNFDYVFYLEDDWLLQRYVSLPIMVNILEKYPNLALLRLPFKPTNNKWSKNWSHIFPWNGDFFICPEGDKGRIGWCGHPSLVKIDFVRDTFQYLNSYICPERQMKYHGRTPMSEVIMKWDYGVYGYPDQKDPTVVDIGRKWRSEKNIIKNNDTTWTFKE